MRRSESPGKQFAEALLCRPNILRRSILRYIHMVCQVSNESTEPFRGQP